MADSDFRVKAIIEANTSNFDKGMKQAQASATNLSNTFGNLSKVITKALSFTGLAIGTKAVVDFGKSCVQSANQAVKTFNILDNTIRATGADAWTSTKELDSMAKTLSGSTNYSVTEIENMQSVLLGFREITGETFQDASDAILDMATVMGMDLTSAVQTVGKALDDPITGLDSLRRQGFKFTDEQKAELAQLVKNGKQLEAQKIILDTLAISYGGASKAGQDSFAKQRHAVENFKDTLGTKLIPIVKVFAEDNAKMINSLRELIENMDFTPVINVVTNLKKIFAEAFNTISGYLRNVGDYVSDFISRFNFKPIISLLDTLIGVLSGVISKFKEINSQKLEIFDKLKEALIDFSNSDTFQNIVNFVNKIIDAVFFLWSEIQDIGTEIRNLIVNKIIEIWGKIKELFQNGQNALSASGQDIASWGDLFYDVLNNTFRSFQDLFGMIKALIHGDWTVAWEYAKLTVMRIADNILDIFSTIANAFPDLVNKFLSGWNFIIKQINKARKFFGQDPLNLADIFESTDLSKETGLEQKIEETEKKIQELTGKSADITIKNLEGVSTKFAGFTQHALGEIGKLTEGVATNSEKQKEYFTGTFSSTEKNGKSTYEKFSEWDSKLLQQRLEDLSEWSDEAHKINLALIEEERKKALEADKTGAETEKINEYYNKQIEKENERSEKAKREMVKETVKIVLSTISNIATKTIEVFKKVTSTIKNIFSGITNVFKNIFDFNPDDALDNLLAIEDAILTFFLETLPKLPGFFASAIQSIVTLIGTLINSIDWGQVQKILNSIIDTIVANMPTIVENLMNLVINIMQTLLNAIVHFVESGGWKTLLDALLTIQRKIEQFFVDNIDTIVQTISDMLPDLINTLIQSIVSASKTLGKLAPKILPLIADLINAIIEVITSDEVLDSSMEAIEGIIAGIIQAIIKLATKAVPKLSNFLLKLHSPATMIKLVTAFVKGLIQAFGKMNWAEVVRDCFMGFIDAIKSLFGIHSPSTLFESFGVNMIEGLWNGLSEMGNWLNENVGGFFRNMWNTITSVFSNVGNWFKNTFSTVGSKITEGFGNIKEWAGNIWKNIQNAFSSVGDWFKNAFSNVGSKISEGFGNVGKWAGDIWDNIKNAFSGVGNWFKNTFESAGNGIKNAFNGLGKWFEDLWNNILNVMKAPINGIIDALNHIIDGFNSISVHIPDWVPFVGGKTFGINIAKIQKLAKGTDNARRGLTLVGEAGPELVNFRGGEQVLNNQNTNKALENMGNKTNNFNIVFNNMQDTTAFNMMQQLKAYNRQMAINGIF